MTITHLPKKKFAALAVLPFAAALTLSACGDSNQESTNVNIQPQETNVASAEDTIAPADTEVDVHESNGELSETSFTQSQNGVEMTLTYIHDGDRVTKQTTRNVIDYEAAGFADKALAQEILDPMIGQADDIEGYEQSIEYGETSAIEEVSVDYEVVDMRDLEGLPGFEGSENMGIADFISLAESRTLLEQQGFTEVE